MSSQEEESLVSEQDSILSENENENEDASKKTPLAQSSSSTTKKSKNREPNTIGNLEENTEMQEEIEDTLTKDELKQATPKKEIKKMKGARSQSASNFSGSQVSQAGSQVLRTTRRGVIRAETESSITTTTQQTDKPDGDKKKTDKKKKKKKDKKRAQSKNKKGKKGKSKGKHKKRRKFHSEDSQDKKSSSSSDSSDSSAQWSIGDSKVDYGSPERLTDGSDQWEGRSLELYDSDNPADYLLNSYHMKAPARLLSLQDENSKGTLVQLQLKYFQIPDKDQAVGKKNHQLDNLNLSYHDKRKMQDLEKNAVDHRSYQKVAGAGYTKPLTLHNMISADFIRGVMKNLTCPICQEMVQSPVIYKSCLHRFCSNCIETYNRQGKKECPLCRIAIGNRRQLRPDKNISALMNHLTEEFKKITRLEELENIEIKRKIIQEQKKLKERKDKQKKVVNNEMRRKYAETQEEKSERLAKERDTKKNAKNGTLGGENSGLDTSHVIKLIEEKKQGIPNMILPVDITLVVKLHHEQAVQGSLMVNKVRLMSNRQISLVHLAILIAHKNGLREDEWPNFEFYPCLLTSQIGEQTLQKLTIGGLLRPFRFKMTVYQILQEIHDGDEDTKIHLELVYKKKQLPQLMNQKTIIKQIQEQQQAAALALKGHANTYTPNGPPQYGGYPGQQSQNSNYYMGGGQAAPPSTLSSMQVNTYGATGMNPMGSQANMQHIRGSTHESQPYGM